MTYVSPLEVQPYSEPPDDDNDEAYHEMRMREEQAAYEAWRGQEGEREDGGDPVVELHAASLRGRLLSTDQLIALPPPDPLIEGVLTRNTLAVLWGKPGCGKTFVAVDWASSLGSGSWWFGRAVQKEWSRVLYLAGEGGQGLGQRAEAWKIDRAVHTSPNVRWLPGSVNLLDRNWAKAMVAVATENDPALVVVDTVARSMVGGDENSTRDMGLLIDVGASIQQATNATVLLVHHDTKAGGAMRGSSALLGAVDTSIECRADGQAITLLCEKQKDARPFEPIRLWREEVGESCAIHCQEGRGSTTDSEARLLETIGSTCGSEGLSTTALFRVSEMPERTYYRALKALREGGFVVNVGSDKQPRWTSRPVVTE